MTPVRLFFAAEPGETVQQTLGQIVVSVLERHPAFRKAGSWTRPENLHLTLQFLGETDPSRLSDLIAAARTALSGIAAENCRLRGYGAFRSRRGAVPVWCPVDDGRGLAEIAGSLARGVERLGYPREQRPFFSHLTLARIRQPEAVNPVLAALERNPVDLVFRAESVTLFQSDLSGREPRYSALAHIALEPASESCPCPIDGGRTS